MYYNFTPLLSRNGVWNFVTGGRGIGKTYGAKKLAISKALKRKRQFIYLRRYKEELQISANTFFADIAHEFPGYQFKRQGSLALAAKDTGDPDAKPDWFTIGHFIALSTAQSYKSVAYPDVDLILFDEYIVDKGRRYLPNEVNSMLNFYSTVDRGNDRVRIIFMANAVSLVNPYFIHFTIEPDGREFIKLEDGFIICHFPEMDDFNNAMKSTRWGRFISGTEYEDFAVANEFADNHEGLIRRKPPEALPLFNLDVGIGVFSLWMHKTTAEWFAQEKLPEGVPVYTTDVSRVTETRPLLGMRDVKLDYARRAYRNGRMLFDKPQTRNAFLKVFK